MTHGFDSKHPYGCAECHEAAVGRIVLLEAILIGNGISVPGEGEPIRFRLSLINGIMECLGCSTLSALPYDAEAARRGSYSPRAALPEFDRFIAAHQGCPRPAAPGELPADVVRP